MAELIVCFFGHRTFNDGIEIEQKLYTLIAELIRQTEYVEFLVGREGEFDLLAASVIRRAKQTIYDANSSLVWVQPYIKAEYLRDPDAYEQYYDRIEFCEQSAVSYPKAAIQLRNCMMVDRSDLCVFYVNHPSGGAWQTLQYALRKNKRVINLADCLQYE